MIFLLFTVGMNCVRVTRRHQYVWANGARSVLCNVEPPQHVSLDFHTIHRPRHTPAERAERENARRVAAENRQANIVANQQATIREAAEQMAAQMVQRPVMVDKACTADFGEEVQIVVPVPAPMLQCNYDTAK